MPSRIARVALLVLCLLGASAEAKLASEEYAGVGVKHWIDDVSGDGSIIKLEDDSTWRVNSADTVTSSIWLPITDVIVRKAKNPVGQYKYIIVNIDDRETVLAKYLGQD